MCKGWGGTEGTAGAEGQWWPQAGPALCGQGGVRRRRRKGHAHLLEHKKEVVEGLTGPAQEQNSETWRGLVLSFHTHPQTPQSFSPSNSIPFFHIPFVTSCPTTPAPSPSALYGKNKKKKNHHKVTFQVLWSDQHSAPGVLGEVLG